VIDATSENPELVEKLFEFLLTGVYDATSTSSTAPGYIFTVHGRHGENTVEDQRHGHSVPEAFRVHRFGEECTF
jgi:hypothetical protein